MRESIKVTQLHYHRNGVCGIGFIAARFTFKEDGKVYSAIATLFDDTENGRDKHYAILTEDNTGKIDIDATWRGDHFADELYAFAKSEEGQRMMHPYLYEPKEVNHAVNNQ